MSVVLRDVVKAFQDPSGQWVRAVDGVSLEVRAGEFVTLLGPSGCGKTTTLRMIAGFETPTQGTIEVGGRDVSQQPPHRRNAPMVFQSYALFPHLTVMENAEYGLTSRGMSAADRRARVQQLAEGMGLAALLDRSPHQLSGGQQQRVALLRALVTEPGLLLFDEPLSNLDPQLRLSMRQEIRRIQKKVGCAAIYVTHDQDEAMSLSDRIVVMERGKISQQGAPSDLYYRPENAFVAGFIGEANFLQARVLEKKGEHLRVQTVLGEHSVLAPRAKSAASETGVLMVRPEWLRLGEGPAARVVGATYLGSQIIYQLEVDGLPLVARVRSHPQQPPFPEGARVGVVADDAFAHWMGG